MRGGVTHHWLDELARPGRHRRWHDLGRPPGRHARVPAAGRPRPAFLLGQRKDAHRVRRDHSRQGWYPDWTARCLGIAAGDGRRLPARLLPAARGRGRRSRPRPPTTAPTRSTGCSPATSGSGCSTTAEVTRRDARLRHLPLGAGRPPGTRCADWLGQPCPRYRCTGRLAAAAGPAEHQTTTTGELYLGAACPTGWSPPSTRRHAPAAQRERVERAFRDGHALQRPERAVLHPDAGARHRHRRPVRGHPRLAAAAPGQLRAAGRPRRAAHRQRVPGHVRRPARPREQYYLAEPRDMIAGEIVPPGCYLSAIEILRRQYLAHLVDLAARGRLAGVLPMPRRASVLFGETGWLSRLRRRRPDRRRRPRRGGSSTCSPRHVDPTPPGELRDFADRRAQGQGRARRRRPGTGRLEDLRDRSPPSTRRSRALVPSDPVQARADPRARRPNAAACQKRIGEIGRTDAHGALVELGLLPNYSLIDVADHPGGHPHLAGGGQGRETGSYHSELREYGRSGPPGADRARPGQSLLHPRLPAPDLRPGHRHDRPPGVGALAGLPECGYVREDLAAQDTRPCPRCDNTRHRRRQRPAQGSAAQPGHLARPAR